MFSRETLADPVALTRALVDIESVSGAEAALAGQVEEALRRTSHLKVERFGNTVVARTALGRPERVVLAGHLDTVPIAGNVPSTVDGDVMYGCGTSDMKSGVALALHMATTQAWTQYDVTYLFYDCEEVESERNGLKLLADSNPELLTEAHFAMLLEPTYGLVEAGCQGTLRVNVATTGRRAHAARSWLGDNAIHAMASVLRTLQVYEARTVTIDGCTFREGLNAVRIGGGVAGNVIPDECTVEVNFRFAPDRSIDDAARHVRNLFDGYRVDVLDAAPAALPGLAAEPVRRFLAAVDRPPQAKLGWTDVARFAALGIPALNFGPGDPNLAHKPEERVEITKILAGAEVLRRWLVGDDKG
jgi:succinyl-diaminopimelate desuccinylase